MKKATAFFIPWDELDQKVDDWTKKTFGPDFEGTTTREDEDFYIEVCPDICRPDLVGDDLARYAANFKAILTKYDHEGYYSAEDEFNPFGTSLFPATPSIRIIASEIIFAEAETVKAAVATSQGVLLLDAPIE